MSSRGAQRLAALVAITSIAMVVASIVLLIPNAAGRPLAEFGSNGAAGLAVSCTYPIVGWLIASRRPGNRIGWIFLVVGLSQSLEALSTQYAVYGLVTDPGSLPFADFASWIQVWAWVPGFLMLGILVLLFPDGELPSPRWRPILWIAGLSFVLMAVPEALVAWFHRGPILLEEEWDATVGVAGAISSTLQIIGVLLSLLVALAAVRAVVVRFQRSMGVERQQLKWVASAGLAEIAMLWFTTGKLVPAPFDIIAAAVIGPLVPIVTAIAILRYRLYEIDRIISRTISYAVITGVLAALFIVVTLVVGALLTSVAQGLVPSSQGRTIAVAASTLIVFALFQPLRRRVQRAVDHRFDRARFDAERTTTAFSERLREEVDLATVTTDLNGTVRSAISPSSVGVWLREGVRK